MSEWPTSDELKRLLDVDTDEYDRHLDRLMEAAIDFVKRDTGAWDETTDVPDDALVNAALRCAMVMRANAEGAEAAVRADPIYQTWMTGHHRRFGFS